MTENYSGIQDLSDTAELELGGENLKAVIAVDNAGNVKLFKPSRIKYVSDLTTEGFPIVTKEITNITAGCIVAHEASPGCITIVIGGTKMTIC